MKSKNLIPVFLILIISLAVFGYFKATSKIENEESLPQIEITPESFNFGKVKYGKILKQNFLVKNKGQKVLIIKRVATSCACTTAEIEKERIDPGQEARLLVRYNTGAMPEKHGKGKQERIIFIQSSDPLNSQVEIKIYANVQ